MPSHSYTTTSLNDPLQGLRPWGGSSKRIKGHCPVCQAEHTFHVGGVLVWCDQAGSEKVLEDESGEGYWILSQADNSGLGEGRYWRDRAPSYTETWVERKAREEREAVAAGVRAARAEEKRLALEIEVAGRLDDKARSEAYRMSHQPLNRADRDNLSRRLAAIGDKGEIGGIIDRLEGLGILGHNGRAGLSAQYLINNHVMGLNLGGQVYYSVGDSKYRWESVIAGGTKRQNGLKAIGVWEPLHKKGITAILTAEGFNKGLMTQILTNKAGHRWLVLGLGGNGFATAPELKSAIEYYKSIYNCPAYLAPDSDWAVNPGVRKATESGLRSGLFDGAIVVPFRHKGPKAIDDLTLEEIKGLRPVSIEDALVSIGAQDVVEYYDASDEAQVRAAIEPIPGMLTLEISPTGTGKSFNAATVAEARKKEGLKTRYVSTDYRNPSDPRLAALPAVQGRHPGLTRRNNKTVVAAKGEAIHEPSNCFQSKEINRLAQSGALGDESITEVVCKACPLYSKCLRGPGMEADGRGYGWLAGVRASKGDHRISPAMLPREDDEAWSSTPFATILDEMETLKDRLTRTLVMQDAGLVNALTTLALADFAFAEKWEPLLRATKGAGKYGRTPEEMEGLIKHLTIEDCDRAIELTKNDLAIATEIEGVPFADLPRSMQQYYVKTRAEKAIAEAIPAFGQAVKAVKEGRGSLAVVGGVLEFQLNTGFAQALLLQGATLLTATPDMALLRAHFGENIRIVASAKATPSENVKIKAVRGLGRCGASRSSYCQKTVPQVIEAIDQSLEPGKKIGVLEHKRYLGLLSEAVTKGTKFGDSKGSNVFYDEGVTDLVVVGSFAPSVSAMALEWATAKAQGLKLSFDEFYQDVMNKHMTQGIGRLRANRRSGEALTVWVIDDKFEGADEETNVAELLQENATGKHSTIVRVANAIKALPEGSYRAIARLAGVTGATVARLFEVACKFIDATNSSEILEDLTDQIQTGEVTEEEGTEIINSFVAEYASNEALSAIAYEFEYDPDPALE